MYAVTWLLALLALLLLARPALACTDGTDCLCDALSGDARVSFCEDFEAVTLNGGEGTGSRGKTGPGSGGTACTPGNASANCYSNTSAPLYGPVYDTTGSGSSSAYGANGYWAKRYGSPFSECLPTNGTPTSGQTNYGDPYVSGNGGAPNVPFDPADRWGLNSSPASCYAIIKPGEWASDNGSLLAPKLPNTETRGQFGGQTFGYRLRNGHNNPGAGGTAKLAPSGVDEVGVTMLVAYSTGIESNTVWNDPWKGEEVGDNNPQHGPFNFCHGSFNDECPFRSNWWINNGNCAAVAAGLTFPGSTGTYECPDNSRIRFKPGANGYVRSTWWPDMNRWACIRYDFKDIRSSSMSIKVTGDFGDGNGERTIYEVGGINSALLSYGPNFFHDMTWNSYTNATQNGHAISPDKAYRYRDNVVVRSGTTAQCAGGACAPISCTADEFGSGIGAPGQPTLCCRQ